jgi:hypothetical protein
VNSGVSFVYRDSTGAVTTVPRAVARVDFLVRGRIASGIALRLANTAPYRGGAGTAIAFRNRQ